MSVVPCSNKFALQTCSPKMYTDVHFWARMAVVLSSIHAFYEIPFEIDGVVTMQICRLFQKEALQFIKKSHILLSYAGAEK